jgi:hypothetical protein
MTTEILQVLVLLCSINNSDNKHSLLGFRRGCVREYVLCIEGKNNPNKLDSLTVCIKEK